MTFTIHSKITTYSSVSLLVLAISPFITTASYASSNKDLEKAGSVIAVAIPAIAYGSTYYKEDKQGREQFYRSFGTTVATTYALKAVIDKERPNGDGDNSFPSSHASAAFQGASFIHRRYGLEYSIPAYLGAGFVAYSRVEADEHDVTDVLAGAALGMVSSWYFITNYDDQLIIAPNVSPDYYGLTVNYTF